MLTTTLNRIRAYGPCKDGWMKLLAGLGKTEADDEPLAYSRIVEINGLDDALWCCRAEPQHSKEWGLFAVWCARQVQHLMTDPRSIEALNVAEHNANGLATDEELAAALDAAGAAWAASMGPPAARAAEAAAWAAVASCASPWGDPWAASSDAVAAASAARNAGEDVGDDSASAAQKEKFIEMVLE
jgi:hypothetical protein